MTKEQDKKAKILDSMCSPRFNESLRGVRLLAELPADESLEIIQGLKHVKGNLAMKLEALHVLGRLITPSNSRKVSRIINSYLGDHDSEIVRNALLMIQKAPSGFMPSKSLVTSITRLLKSSYTDNAYHALLALLSLREHLKHEEFRRHLEPLTTHTCDLIRNEASAALR